MPFPLKKGREEGVFTLTFNIWFVALLLTIQFVVLFEERNYNVSSGVALWTIRS